MGVAETSPRDVCHFLNNHLEFLQEIYVSCYSHLCVITKLSRQIYLHVCVMVWHIQICVLPKLWKMLKPYISQFVRRLLSFQMLQSSSASFSGVVVPGVYMPWICMSLVLCDEIQTVCLDSVLHNLLHVSMRHVIDECQRAAVGCSVSRLCLGADDPWDASQILYAAFMLSLLVTKLDASWVDQASPSLVSTNGRFTMQRFLRVLKVGNFVIIKAYQALPGNFV